MSDTIITRSCKLSKKAQASIEKMLEKFESGDISPLIQAATFELPEDAPAAKWSYPNKVLAFAQGGCLDCRGYDQWKKADRQVKPVNPGESRAVYIFGPRKKKVTKIDKETGDEIEIYINTGFVPIPVFPAHETEGDGELPDYTPVEPPPLADLAEELGIAVHYTPMVGALGDCTVSGNEIRLGTDEAKVFFHELAHAIHARLEGSLKGGQVAEQETVAEFTACVLMDLYGLGDYSGNAWSYISFYNKKDPLRAIQDALKVIERVLEFIQMHTRKEYN